MDLTLMKNEAFERFKEMPQDVAVVLNYNQKMHVIVPNELERRIDGMSDKEIEILVDGVIVEEEQLLLADGEHQVLNFRAETSIDVFSLGLALLKDDSKYAIVKMDALSTEVFYGVVGSLVAPAMMSLVEIKEDLQWICFEHKVYNCHVLIESLDFPVFKGMRDRESPNPAPLCARLADIFSQSGLSQ